MHTMLLKLKAGNSLVQTDFVVLWSIRIECLTCHMVLEHTHTKLCFIFTGFDNVPGLETKDYITVSIVERYLDFKVKYCL